MKHCTYTTVGTCSRQIDFDLDDAGRVSNLRFTGGCPGNTAGISKLAEGMDARTLADRLRGVLCRDKGTSCPDQLARAIDSALG